MKNIVKFLGFILYSTSVFFFPNNKIIFIFAIINLITNFISKVPIIKVWKSTLKIFPFIIFTFLINFLLDEFYYAMWIGIKLIIVCNIINYNLYILYKGDFNKLWLFHYCPQRLTLERRDYRATS